MQVLRGYSTDSDDPGYLTAQIDRCEEIRVFRFDVPILASDISASLAHTTSHPSTLIAMKQRVNDWKFADVHGVSTFGDATVATLFEGLAMSEHKSEDIASLTLYIYHQTPDGGHELDFKDRNILRRLISSYIAYHSAELQSSVTFRDLMCSGREVALDVWMEMGIIRGGHVGKGWR